MLNFEITMQKTELKFFKLSLSSRKKNEKQAQSTEMHVKFNFFKGVTKIPPSFMKSGC